MIGYSLHGALRDTSLAMVAAANAASAPSVSLDVPSGLDSTTGEQLGAAVNADATLTLAAPKLALRTSDLVGRLFLGDISVPRSVFASLGFNPPTIFVAGEWIVEVNR